MQINNMVGFQQFTSQTLGSVLSCSTALLTDANGNKANAAEFSVGGTTGAIRFRDDGTAPTTIAGTRIPVGTLPYLYQGNIHQLKFIADEIAGNASLAVRYLHVTD